MQIAKGQDTESEEVMGIHGTYRLKEPIYQPPPKKQKPVRTCADCGDKSCRKKWRAVTWRRCGRWVPELEGK